MHVVLAAVVRLVHGIQSQILLRPRQVRLQHILFPIEGVFLLGPEEGPPRLRLQLDVLLIRHVQELLLNVVTLQFLGLDCLLGLASYLLSILRPLRGAVVWRPRRFLLLAILAEVLHLDLVDWSYRGAIEYHAFERVCLAGVAPQVLNDHRLLPEVRLQRGVWVVWSHGLIIGLVESCLLGGVEMVDRWRGVAVHVHGSSLVELHLMHVHPVGLLGG